MNLKLFVNHKEVIPTIAHFIYAEQEGHLRLKYLCCYVVYQYILRIYSRITDMMNEYITAIALEYDS